MSKIHWKYKGFTLVEAIVVISIMGMMALLIFVNYHDYNKRNQLREGNQLIRSALVEAQNMALAPKDQTPDVEYYYGVCIDENQFLFGKPADDKYNNQKINIYRFKFNQKTYKWWNPPQAKDVYELIKSYDLPAPVKYLKCDAVNFYGLPTYSPHFAIFFKPASTGVYYPNVSTAGMNNLITYRPTYAGGWPGCKFTTYLSLTDNESQTESSILGAETGQISMAVPPPPPCFAADSNINVLLKNGSIASKRISEVLPGDLVESSDPNRHVTFSKVWAVVHNNEIKITEVLNLTIKRKNGNDTSLSLTPEHFLYIKSESNSQNNDGKFVLKEAREARIGDKLLIRNDQNSTSNADSFTEAIVTSITSGRTRIINILTINDRVVVNGILASVYIENPSACAAAASPFKISSNIIGPKVPNQMLNFYSKHIENTVVNSARAF